MEEDIIDRAIRMQKEAVERLEARKREQLESEFWDRQSNSNMGKRNYKANFRNLIVNDANKEIIDEFRKYVKKPTTEHEKGFFLYGECGTGKTYITAALLNELMWQKKRQAFMSTFIEIGNEIRAAFNKRNITPDDVIWKYSTATYLAIDDIGTERFEVNGTENWLQEQIFTIVNNRYKNMKPTFYTSNYSLEELSKRGLANKIVDRIWQDSLKVFELKDKNHRV